MKLRNKKTGKIFCWDKKDIPFGFGLPQPTSLAELNEEWEDYEEPKWLRDYWFIDSCGGINKQEGDILGVNRGEIGNYFETKEEAEKAVEKLKALRRLKELGFRFIGKTCEYKPDKHFGSVFFETSGDVLDIYEDIVEFYDDLNLLFGGEE